MGLDFLKNINVIVAHKVFDEVLDKSRVGCWTLLLVGFARSGQTKGVFGGCSNTMFYDDDDELTFMTDEDATIDKGV